MRRTRFTLPVVAGLLLLAFGIQTGWANTSEAVKRSEMARQWAAEHPESCALLDDQKAVSMMDSLLLKLAVLCGRDDLLGGVLQGENEGFDPDALGTDVRANDPNTDTGSSRTQSETSVSVNETTGMLCAGYNDSFHGVTQGQGYTGFSSSADAGVTWVDHGALGSRSFGDPGMVWRKMDGNFYFVALDTSGLGIWRSTDDCQTFTFLANPHVGGSDDKELLAIDNNPSSPHYGRMYVAWTDFSTGQISVVNSDNGTTWTAPVRLSGAGISVQGAWPAVAPNGDVWVDWVRWNPYPSGPIDIEVARSTNGGTSFALVTDPMTGQVNPRDNTATGNCGRPALNGNIRYLPSPQIAIGPDGALHVVYSYDPDGNGTGDVSNVYYRRSTDNGATWGPEIQLNDDATTRDQWQPSLSVGATNVVSTSWYDRRDDAGNLRFKYFERMSFDGGLTFGASQQISDTDSPVVLDPNLATCYHGDYDTQIQTASAAVEVWSDDRGTEGGGNNPDVWTDTTAISSDFLVIPSPVTQTICAGSNADVNISVPSFNGFTDPVTLGVTGNPGGTTANFSVNPVTPPGSSVLTIGNTGSVATGSYPMTITGTSGASSHDGSANLDVFAGLPGSVTLLTPTNGSINQPVDVTLTWSSDPNDGTYTVEIATDPSFSNIVDSASGLDMPSYVPNGLATNTTYYWRVHPTNACGDGAMSVVFHFSTVAGPRDCATGSVPHSLYSYGFESGDGGWTHSGTQDTWGLTTNGLYVHSGTQAFHATDPGSISDQRLVSPAIALPSGEDPVVLEFWNFQTMEHRTGGCYDGGIVEVSTDGGTTWTQVGGGNLLTDPYDGLVSTSFGNPLGGLDAWCGDPQPFLNSIVDVTAYAGQTVQFRFRLGSDNSVNRTDGWNIDDVYVQSCMASGGLPFNDGFESGDTTAWSQTQP